MLDLALAGLLAAIALQLFPLSAQARARVAPSSVAFERAVALVEPAGNGPITVDRDATTYALYVDALVILLFWSARQAFERGGMRRVVRAIAVFGLVAAPLGVAQHVWAPRLFYGAIRPISTNALPFTPFVNRNDFAAWLLMAIPAVLGYAMARVQSRRHEGVPFDPEETFDNQAIMLGLSIFAMTAALLASLSRSGLLGLTSGALLFLIGHCYSTRTLGSTDIPGRKRSSPG